MMNVEMASQSDKNILNEILRNERYSWIKSYDVKIEMFFKYGKYDKEGNLKSPALVKNGKAIPISTKVVSSFNRLTDDVDVKLIINKELWDEYTENEKKSVIDNAINYLELKTDKIGEPLTISEDSDKVQIKLKHPDFYCEGFINMVEKYGSSYIPLQEAHSIVDLKKFCPNLEITDKSKKITNKKEDTKELIDEDVFEQQETPLDLDDIKL